MHFLCPKEEICGPQLHQHRPPPKYLSPSVARAEQPLGAAVGLLLGSSRLVFAIAAKEPASWREEGTYPRSRGQQ